MHKPEQATSEDPWHNGQHREGADRRTSARNSAIVSHAVLGWKVGAEFCQSRAMLSDISVGGCQALIEEKPPEQGIVLLRLDGGILPVWFEAKVLELKRVGLRIWQLRLSFPEGCPYEFYMAVAYGIVNKESDRQVELPAFNEKPAPKAEPRPKESFRFWERG